MNESVRRRMTLAAAAGILASAGGLAVLRFSRPAFYTDGEAEVSASTLVAAPALVFGAPEPEVEVPGPVSGRIERLPDGRLVYGRVLEDGTTDLVLFDPARPGVPPEPAPGLNSPGHDLAPALAAGGVLLFASDRAGGAGGFDLYAARITGGSFTNPERLSGAVNTALDETDPAPDPAGQRLVFVRRDPALAEGRNGTLMVVAFDASAPGGAANPAAANAPEAGAAATGAPAAGGAGAAASDVARALFTAPRGDSVVLDRDPCFAPASNNLWFVRQVDSAPASIMRTWSHRGEFVPPRAQEVLSGGGSLRSPRVSADGFTVHLLRPGPPSLIYAARGHEVFPWWEGQRRLESALVSFLLFCGLLIVLLHLGRRWRTLDLVTQCLLLSLLVHALVLLWLSRVEIVRVFAPVEPREPEIEVQFSSDVGGGGGDAAEGGAGAGGIRQVHEDLSALLGAFDHSASLAPGTPGTDVGASALNPQGPPAPDGGADPAPSPGRGAGAARIEDQVAAVAARSGADARGSIEARPAAVARAREAAPEARRPAGAADAVFKVAIPAPETGAGRTAAGRTGAGGGPGAGTGTGTTAGDVPGGTSPLPAPRAFAVVGAAVADAPVQREGARAQVGAAGGSGGGSTVAPAPGGLGTGASGPGAPVLGAGLVPGPGSATAGTSAGNAALAGEPAPGGLLPLGRSGAGSPGDGHSGEGRGSGGSGREPPGPGALQPPAPRALAAAPQLKDGVADGLGGGAGGLAAGAGSRPAGAGAGAGKVEGRQVGVAGPAAPALGSGVGPNGHAGSGSGHEGIAGADAPQSGGALGRAGRSAGQASGGTPGGAGVPLTGAAPGPARNFGSAVALRDGAGASEGTGALAGVGAAGAKAATPDSGAPGSGTPGSGAPGSGSAVPGPLARGSGSPAGGGPVASALRPSSAAAGLEPSGAGGGFEPLRRGSPSGTDRGGSGDGAGTGTGPGGPGSFLEKAGRRAAPREDGGGGVAVAPDSLYGNRFGPKKAEALDRFGGTRETEAAVAAGLRYLGRVQNADGSWGDTGRTQPKYGEVFVGKTALCLLAFLGAGHTPASGTEYSKSVRNAVEYLLSTQDEKTGHFGVTSSYSNGITTYALAECLALTGDKRLKPPLTKAVEWILAKQSTSNNAKNRGGWPYYSPQLRAEDSYSRASITAWQVMALESAKLSGIEVPDEAMDAAKTFLLNCHDPRHHYFLYNHDPSRLSSSWRTLPGSTPASVFCLLLLGIPAKDPRLQDGLKFTLDRAPKDYRKVSDEEFVIDAAGNTYFWYYGSLACFMAGGETWEKWNRALKEVLPAAQEKDGSFPPIDPYARYADDRDGDRSYTTAICVLSLEVYYRYFTPLLNRR